MPSPVRILFIALLLGAAACSSGVPPDTPGSVVLIVVDTLRGDRLGASGYARAVTPVLDSLAAAGTRFADAMTPAPVTLPATASLLTGRLPFEHGVRDNGGFVLDPAEETLAERFRARGWRTGAVVASAVLAADRGLDQGFETWDDRFEGPYPVYEPSLRPLAGDFAKTRRRADTVTDRALAVLDGFGDAPFFLLVHYFDVHMHYDPPPSYAGLHPGRPYDGEVSFVDHEIGRLLGGLRGRPDALVVVVADHGESQNEHGEPQHGFLLYQSTLHVPFLVAGPGVPRGLVRTDPVSLVDVEPTLARVFGLPRAATRRNGRALDWDRPETQPATLYAEAFRPLISYRWSELRALRFGEWKYISGPVAELYRVVDDPAERVQVDAPDVDTRFEEELASMIAGDDPLAVYQSVHGGGEVDRSEMLESLGYVGESDRGALPRRRPHPADMLPGWVAGQVAREYARQAAWYLDAGDARRAAALLDSALARDERLADGWFLRGVLHDRGRAGVRAEAAYRRCLELKDEHPRALEALAELLDTRGEADEALALWTRLAAAEPGNRLALTRLSESYLGTGEPDRALVFLRRLSELDPDNPEIHFNLGIAAGRIGREEEARSHLRRYLELDPDSEHAAEIRSML